MPNYRLKRVPGYHAIDTACIRASAYATLEDQDATRAIAGLTEGYTDKTEYFVDRLSRGLARIAAAHTPNPVIVRMSDFKTNEYAHLIGGSAFEPKEENPMLGFRGASRYYSPRYREGFALECRAIMVPAATESSSARPSRKLSTTKPRSVNSLLTTSR